MKKAPPRPIGIPIRLFLQFDDYVKFNIVPAFRQDLGFEVRGNPGIELIAIKLVSMVIYFNLVLLTYFIQVRNYADLQLQTKGTGYKQMIKLSFRHTE